MTAFVAGRMPAVAQSLVRAHLDTCPDCRAIVLAAVKHHHPTPSREVTELAIGSEVPSSGTVVMPRRTIATGDRIGPYEIERLLGAGGMGVVYAARDPRLDRTVAMKLI